MLNEMNERFFTTKRAAKACGISPTTLIRMQKEGLILPTNVDAKNGYRLYETHEIAGILQFLKLRSFGLSKEETYDHYYGKSDIKQTISALMRKINTLSFCVDELELRFDAEKEYHFETLDIPDLYCYTHSEISRSASETVKLVQDTFHAAVLLGCRILPDELIFTMRKDNTLKGNSDAFSVTACIPVDKSNSPDIPEIQLIAGGKLFSCIFKGSYEDAPKVHSYLFDALKEQKLVAKSGLRTFGIVAPYIMPKADESQFVTRFGVLI